MSKEPEWTQEQVEEALAWKRQQLAEHEEQWKQMRQESKDLTLRLILDYRESINRASYLSGHSRATVTNWLTIHNAEKKAVARALAERDKK